MNKARFKEIEEFVKDKDDHWGCYKMMRKELKIISEAQVMNSITGYKKKKEFSKFFWFLMGFLCCELLIVGIIF